MHYIQALPTVLAVLLFVFLGFLVIHNQHKLANKLFVAFIAIDSLWLVSVFIIDFTWIGRSSTYNVYAGRSAFALATALVMSVHAFINALLGFKHSKKYRTFIYGFGSLLLLIILASGAILKGVHLVSNSNLPPSPIYGVLYPLFLVYIVPAATLVFLMLFKQGKTLKRQSVTKQQLDVVAIGITLFAASNLLTNLILQIILSSAWPSQFMPIGSAMLALSFFYAIGKHKLFDVRIFVLRAAAYLSTLFIMTFVLVAPVILIFSYFLNFHPKGTLFAALVFLSVGTLYLLQYLRKTFDQMTARVFFRGLYEPQDVLDNLSEALVQSLDLSSLQQHSAQILSAALRPRFISYIISSEKSKEFADLASHLSAIKQSDLVIAEELDTKNQALIRSMAEHNVAIAVKLRTKHEDIGYLVLGYKESGELYTTRDRRLLLTAASEVAISLQNALRFEEIQNFNKTLQERVEDATRRLRESNRKLKLLDETKDDFISMASHQLRTPLTSVKGYISLVLDGDAGPVPQSQRKLLTQAYISSQRMVFLIADLLNVSRLRTGKFVIEPIAVNLADLVDDEVAQLVETAESRSLTLTYHKPAHFPVLQLDETKTRQVIMNFIDNAIYYTPAGGHINVQLLETPRSVELRVVDDGMGVPKTEQHHLFTKFYRAKNAQKARPDGTGLGLFMAKKVIVAQGGAIIFTSQEGQGSTFGFSFAKDHHAAK